MKPLSLTALSSALVIAFGLVAASGAQAAVKKDFEVPGSCQKDMSLPENVEKCGRALMRSTYVFGNVADGKLGYAVIPGVTDEETRQKALQARTEIRTLCKQNQLQAFENSAGARDSQARLTIVKNNVVDQVRCMELVTDVIKGFEDKGRAPEGMTAKAQSILDVVRNLPQDMKL